MVKKQKIIFVTIFLIVILVVSALVFLPSRLQKNTDSSVYVGVSYGGNSVTEAKQLIDKVKSYTNLFVLASGTLQRDPDSINEIGDYAIAANMYFMPYFGNYVEETLTLWLDHANQRWGDHMLGIYYRDELGGKMLDDYSVFTDPNTGDTLRKTRYGDVVVEKTNGITIHYELNGNINHYEPTSSDEGIYSTFYPNGTITVKPSNGKVTTTYKQLLAAHPFKNSDEVAQQFLARTQGEFNFLKKTVNATFSSDYALFWYNYKAGYDVVLAQLGWNISLNQQISLCRGAAIAQQKDWGAIITWRYTTPPYLDTGTEIYNQLKTSYECGAKYLVLFDFYEENSSNPYGTLKEEHFNALKRFWHNVAQNPNIEHGLTQANTVLILPKNFGGGLRWREDTIWGIFKADETSGKIWDLTQSTLNTHGYNLDIIYDDPAYQISPQYTNIIKYPTE
ncbi:MAG: hypothetical protein FWC30_08965 [Candidatus Bathyarchaeota archaeon]|nr:hypothetical protein [Candidatus Termiticorpusculum sp.]